MVAEDILAAARVRAVSVHPYFSAALFRLNFVENSRCDTMSADMGLRCFYAPERITKWGVEIVAGILVHQVGHVLREHARRRGERDPATWNTSCDAEINDDFSSLPLPEGAIQPEKLKHPVTGAPLVRGLTAEEYHAILSTKPPEPESNSSDPSEDKSDDEGDSEDAPGESESGSEGEDAQDDGESAESDEQPGEDAERVPGQGGCGGCAGNPAPWEDELDPDDPDPVSEAEQEMMRHNVADQIIEHAKNRGTLPGSWRAWAKSKLAPPTIDWRKRLAGLVRRAIADASGASDYTLRKPSRRAAGLRAVFGDRAPAIPALVQPIPKVGIILDTSWSMSGPTFATALSETVGVVKAIGFPVETIACDSQVQARTSLVNERGLAKLGFSGGGTDLRVGIDAAQRAMCEVIVVITDGETPWPEQGTMRDSRLIAVIINDARREVPDWIPAVRPK